MSGLLVYPLEKSLFCYVLPSKQAYYLPLALISDDLSLPFEEAAVLYYLDHHGLASISSYHSHYNMKIVPNAVYLLRCVLDWVDNNRYHYYLNLLYEHIPLVKAGMSEDLYHGICHAISSFYIVIYTVLYIVFYIVMYTVLYFVSYFVFYFVLYNHMSAPMCCIILVNYCCI